MDIARQIFNNQHCTTELTDLFSKRYKINENDHVFCWLCLNEVRDYYLFLRVCEFANQCCVMKTDKGFDITVDMREHTVLINDMKKWVLNRRMIKRDSPNGYDPNENISSYRISRYFKERV